MRCRLHNWMPWFSKLPQQQLQHCHNGLWTWLLFHLYILEYQKTHVQLVLEKLCSRWQTLIIQEKIWWTKTKWIQFSNPIGIRYKGHSK
jgi:hypothetical protein